VNRAEREKERKRQEILDAAEKLFAEKGFKHVTMAEIAKAAEFTRKTIYSYFASKEDLYLEAFARIATQRWGYLVAEMKKTENGLPRIQAFGNANYDYTMANPEHFKMIVYLDHYGMDFKIKSNNIQGIINEARTEIMELLDFAYKHGQADGSIRADLDISKNQIYLGLSLRTMLNEIVLGYCERDFYFDFLELFIDAIKTRSI